MKKILLSCVTCLLALGLVTACDDEVEDVTPEDPNAGVVEPGGDDGGGTSGGGSGDTSTGSGHYVGKEVSEYVSGESYLLGMVTADGKTHYGTGEMSGYYGATTTDYEAANSYTITDVDGGVTLSTVVEGKTVYVTMAASDGHYNLVYSETAQVLTYDSEYNTFTITTQVEVTDNDGEPVVDEETQDPVYEDYTLFLGTYGDYSTLGWYNYAWISQSGEYPAHLYEVVELSNPTSISITGEETSVEEGKTIQLTASVTPADAYSEVVWSTSDEKVATVSESGLVTGVAVGNATITATSVTASAVSGSIVITVTEVAPLPEGMIGYFDFSSYSGTAGTIISTDDALDEFWISDEEDIYLGARQHESVYLGNNTGGALGTTTECLKFGLSGVGGLLQLKFALGTDIDEVVITAHSWYAVSASYPDQTPETLTVNGTTQDCSVSGTPTDLTYTISGDLTYLLTLESSERIFITSIVIYGTTGNSYDPITSLTISSDAQGALNVGDSLAVSVSYAPDTTVFDIDTLVWESTIEEVATVERTVNGATIRAVGSGTTQISAQFESIKSNELSIEVEDTLQEQETILVSSLSGDDSNHETISFSGHQVSVVVDQNKNGGGNSSSAPYYGQSQIRVYYNQTITFTPLYEEATITSIVLTVNSGYTGSSTATLTDLSGTTAGSVSINSDTVVTLVPTNTTGALVYTNVKDSNNTQLRFTQITIYYSLSN